MRDFILSLKKTGLAAGLGIVFGLLAFGQAAQAAYPWELNFWLTGPRYDGRVDECERALSTISSQFREKESTFWNSPLQITKPRSGPGSPTTFPAATAPATSC
jgi:hypothetical protein